MPERDARHTRRGLRRWSGAALAVALVAAGGVSWQQGWAEDAWHRLAGGGEGSADPAAVAPPPEVDVAPVAVPAPVARRAQVRPTLDGAAVRAALAAPLADPDLGRNVLAAVAPLKGDGPTIRTSSTSASLAMPASTTKVVTSAVGLSLLGPDHTFRTRTVLEPAQGSGAPRLVLVGGGDPLLASAPEPDDGDATYDPPRADVRTLAARTARALRKQGVTRVRLGYDASLFTGPSGHPSWRAYPKLEVEDYIRGDVVSPISALWVDEGRATSGYGREDDPAAAAAQAFAAALAGQGIAVAGAAENVVAAAGARPVATVHSPTVAQIVQRILEVSDNEAAEVLLRHIGVAAGEAGSFEGGQAAVRRTLSANGIPLGDGVLYDGSGLSRDNRLEPGVLVEVVRWAARTPDLRAVLTGLPVAGFTGSLTNRMDRGAAEGRGRVRAKTGTLTGVTSLAGIAIDLDGNLMAFALMADQVPRNKDLLARVAEDNAAAALGACHCGS